MLAIDLHPANGIFGPLVGRMLVVVMCVIGRHDVAPG